MITWEAAAGTNVRVLAEVECARPSKTLKVRVSELLGAFGVNLSRPSAIWAGVKTSPPVTGPQADPLHFSREPSVGRESIRILTRGFKSGSE